MRGAKKHGQSRLGEGVLLGDIAREVGWIRSTFSALDESMESWCFEELLTQGKARASLDVLSSNSQLAKLTLAVRFTGGARKAPFHAGSSGANLGVVTAIV